MKKITQKILITLWFVCFGMQQIAIASSTNDLTGVQVIGKNQLVFRLSSSFKYHYFTLASPDRLVIDFDQTNLKTNLNTISWGNLPVRSARTSVNAQKTLRIVLDLKSKQSTSVHLFPASNGQPWRLSLFFNAALQKTTTAAATAKPQIAVKTTNSMPALNAKATYKPRLVVVVIDPGHGGKDPGAHGKYGTREKEVVLGIARQLQYLINRQPGMKAVLTRSGDYYIDLRQRLAIARKDSADLFVSIHADAFVNPYSHGASVYALSERGGTSEAARWLAAKENYSELGGVDLGELDDKDGMVRSVLIDLSQTATIGASLELGGGVLRNMGQITRLHHHSVEQAQFVVLKSLDIPSILVETGFISNPQEEKNLRNPAYQAKLARSILLGIQYYLRQHPPTDSYWVAKK